jgi:catechol-2,3-dioxygenase
VTSSISGGICELVLESEDVDGLASFYEGIGLERLSSEGDRVWLKAGERSRLGVWSPGEKEHDDRGGRHVHFALSVEPGTLDRLAEELRGEGLEVSEPVEHDGGDRSVYFFDPAGNRVELWDFFTDGEGADEGVEPLGE